VIPVFRGFSAAQAGPNADATALAPLGREVQPCIGDRLSGGDERELADAIKHPQPWGAEVCTAIELDRRAYRRA
jgi:hypothetical protein